jgi:phosphomannomutase
VPGYLERLKKDARSKAKYDYITSNGYTQEDFTVPNVGIVAEAIIQYNLKKAAGGIMPVSGTSEEFKKRLEEKGIIVAYDNRPANHRYAEEIARISAACGVKATLAETDSRYVPTSIPMVSLMIKRNGYAGAITLTASHNGDEWNGIKFNSEDGGAASPAVTDEIGAILKGLFASAQPSYDIAGDPVEELRRLGKIATADIVSYYVGAVLDYIGKERVAKIKEAIKEKRAAFIYSAFYGSSGLAMKKIFERLGLPPEDIIEVEKPGGVYVESYEPTLERLKGLKEKVAKAIAGKKARVVIGAAADNDADRYQVNENAEEITPARLAPILGHYLVTSRSLGQKHRAWGRSFVSSSYQDSVAQLFGQKTKEEATGFKFSPPVLGSGGIIYSEESYGLSFCDWTLDKDGILPSILALDLVANTGRSLREYEAGIKEELKKKNLPCDFHFERYDIKLAGGKKEEAVKRFTEFYNDIKEGSTAFARKTIVKRYDPGRFEGGMKFVLSDGSWAAFRSSGTEPIIRVYAEARSSEDSAVLKKEISALIGI